MKIKGMWTDGSPRENPKNTTRNNKNIVLTESLGSITNEKGFDIYSNNYNDKKQIGKIQLNDGNFVLFSVTNDNSSEIGIVNSNGYYLPIVKNSCLNFNLNYPIDGEFEINNKNERIISWVDKINEPKLLNIDNLPNPFTCDSIQTFNKANTPCLTSDLIEGGGSLLTGAYYPIIQYIREDFSTSNWFKYYSPIFVTDKSINTGYDQNDGSLSGILSNKSIQLIINNIDQTYKKINIGFIYQKEGNKTAHIYKEYDITSTNLNVFITNNNNLIDLDLSEIIIDKAIYKNAERITELDSTLYLQGLKLHKEPNQQTIVNNIFLNWYSEKNKIVDYNFNCDTDNKGYKFHDFNNKKRHFQHGEVYAFYIQYEYKWGWGKNYVLNGRLPNAFDLQNYNFPVTIEAEYNCNNGLYKNYQIVDTGALISKVGNVAKGHFGYWENQNETYPTTGGFPTGKVRHFKFPSLNWMRNNVWTNVEYGTNELDTLGITLHNFNLNQIKDCDGDQAINYRIGFAKRNGANNSVVGQSNTLSREGVNFNYVHEPTLSYNYLPRNRYRDGSYQPLGDNQDPVRTYPFELLRSKNSNTVNFFRIEYLLESSEILKYKFFYSGLSSIFGSSLLNDNILLRTKNAIIDYVNSNNIIPISTGILQNIYPTKTKFIPNNVTIPYLDNSYLEEFVQLEGLINRVTLNQAVTPYKGLVTKTEKTYLITLLSIKPDYYLNFNNQEIVYFDPCKNANNPLFGGDTYICDYSINTLGNAFEESTNDITIGNKDHKNNGLRIARRILVESVYNINLRHVHNSNLEGYTEYYPKSGVEYLNKIERDRTVNNYQLGYNTDFNALNDITNYDIWSGIDNKQYDLPFRIIRGQKFDKESNINYWREFKQNDYFELVKDKGEVINLESGRNFLYIHHKHSLFKTQPRDRFINPNDNNSDLIYIGYGDIFEFPPVEIIHDELGQLGTQHKWSCSLTDQGYLFCDSEKGKWFLINDSVKIISDNGKERFFLKNSDCYGDNPYIGDSIQSVYDEEFNRILITRNFKDLKDKNKFKGIWKNDKFFISSLQSGDIIYKDNKFQTIQ